MKNDEFDTFKMELKQLCASFGKAYTDALGQAYWRVLRDVELDEVQQNVERILLNATKETRFPRPTELRTTPAPRVRTSLENDPALAKAFERNRANWREALATGSPLAQWHLLGARLARIDVEEEAGSLFQVERLREAKQVAQQLLRDYGPKWCVADPHCMHAASRLLGGEYIAWKNPS